MITKWINFIVLCGKNILKMFLVGIEHKTIALILFLCAKWRNIKSKNLLQALLLTVPATSVVLPLMISLKTELRNLKIKTSEFN